ncbi:MAG: hypothetical protein CMH98_16375 [Oceanospirillaceae bacterium]|nr:hypothetical protein [Oceanospirillaceae bacterium]
MNPLLQKLEALGLSHLLAVIDIETLARGPDAKIMTIGVSLENILYGEQAEDGTFYVRVDRDQCGRVECSETLQWWEEQKESNPEAYAEVFDESLERVSLAKALRMLTEFLEKHIPDIKQRQVMGNGSEFDNVILSHAYESYYHSKTPWHHKGNQSLRTVVYLGRLVLGIDPKYTLEKPEGFIEHHALDDAEQEGRYAQVIIQGLLELPRKIDALASVARDTIQFVQPDITLEKINSEDLARSAQKALDFAAVEPGEYEVHTTGNVVEPYTVSGYTTALLSANALNLNLLRVKDELIFASSLLPRGVTVVAPKGLIAPAEEVETNGLG